MKIFIKSYGCQANINDSEQMAGLLKEKGHDIVDSEDQADKIIVNSCSVKNATQSKILHYINENIKTKKVLVGGCLTKTLNLRERYPELEAVFDTNSVSKISDLVDDPHDLFSHKKEKRISAPVVRVDKDVGIISIGEGCLNRCTFCATKLARGNLRSYRIGDIKRQVEKAVTDGCKRINLTSQDDGCYGFDIDTDLPSLLNELITIEGDFTIRVGMMNPWHLDKVMDGLLEVFESDKIFKFLHIPVQAGSEQVLKHMRRIHTVENFKDAVEKFRAKFSGMNIATDIIVGYPSETEEDFQETLELIEETKPEVVNISRFSSRQGTDASKMKQISSEIMKDRSQRLHEVIKKQKEEKVLLTI